MRKLITRGFTEAQAELIIDDGLFLINRLRPQATPIEINRFLKGFAPDTYWEQIKRHWVYELIFRICPVTSLSFFLLPLGFSYLEIIKWDIILSVIIHLILLGCYKWSAKMRFGIAKRGVDLSKRSFNPVNARVNTALEGAVFTAIVTHEGMHVLGANEEIAIAGEGMRLFELGLLELGFRFIKGRPEEIAGNDLRERLTHNSGLTSEQRWEILRGVLEEQALKDIADAGGSGCAAPLSRSLNKASSPAENSTSRILSLSAFKTAAKISGIAAGATALYLIDPLLLYSTFLGTFTWSLYLGLFGFEEIKIDAKEAITLGAIVSLFLNGLAMLGLNASLPQVMVEEKMGRYYSYLGLAIAFFPPIVHGESNASMVNSQWPIDYRLSTIDPFALAQDASSPAQGKGEEGSDRPLRTLDRLIIKSPGLFRLTRISTLPLTALGIPRTGFLKSHPRAFHNIVDCTGLTAAQHLFFDDRPDLVALAKQVGLSAVQFNPLRSRASVKEIIAVLSGKTSGVSSPAKSFPRRLTTLALGALIIIFSLAGKVDAQEGIKEDRLVPLTFAVSDFAPFGCDGLRIKHLSRFLGRQENFGIKEAAQETGAIALAGAEKLGLNPGKVAHLGRMFGSVANISLCDAVFKGSIAARYEEERRPIPYNWRAGAPYWLNGYYWGSFVGSLGVTRGIEYGINQPGGLWNKFRYVFSYWLIHSAWEHPLYWIFIPANATPQVEWSGAPEPFSLRRGNLYPKYVPWMSLKVKQNELNPSVLVSRYLFGAQPGMTNYGGVMTAGALALVASYFILPQPEEFVATDRTVLPFRFSPGLYHDLEGSFAPGQGVLRFLGDVKTGINIQFRTKAGNWSNPLFIYNDSEGKPSVAVATQRKLSSGRAIELGADMRLRPWDKVHRSRFSVGWLNRKTRAPYLLKFDADFSLPRQPAVFLRLFMDLTNVRPSSSPAATAQITPAIESLRSHKADITFIKADLKITPDQEVKILELGMGWTSEITTGIMEGFWENFKFKTKGQVPVWLVMDYFIQGLCGSSLLQQYALNKMPDGSYYGDIRWLPLYLKDSKFGRPKIDFDPGKIATYSGVVILSSLHTGFDEDFLLQQQAIIRDLMKSRPDLLFFDFVQPNWEKGLDLINNKLLSYLLLEGPNDYLPRQEFYSTQYEANLAERIQQDIPAQIYTIKQIDKARTEGVFVVTAEDLQDLFLDKKFNWLSSQTVFLVQEFIAGEPLLHQGKKFDPTIRTFFVILVSDGRVNIKVLDSYCSVPRRAIHEG
ncbi:MAG: hypothetical protein ACOY3D_07720, partial [Candidatus Omnitrophota bacterium]